MRKLFIIAAVALGLFAVGCNDDYTPSVSLQQTFANAYPDAVDVEWERERHHIVVDFKLPGVSNDCEAWFTKSGDWVLTEYKIAYSALPEAVRSAFETGYGIETPVDSVYHVVRSNGDDIYTIEATTIFNDLLTDIFLSYSADGTLLRTWADVENDDYIYYFLDY